MSHNTTNPETLAKMTEYYKDQPKPNWWDWDASQWSILMDTDSYKVSMWKQYPPDTKYVSSYIEARGGRFPNTVFFGLQAFLKKLEREITATEVEFANAVWTAHGEPFPYELVKKIVTEHGGKLPVKIEAVEEGTVVPVKNALVRITNTDPDFWWLPTWIETALLRAVWFPTTVATLSWSIKQIILGYLEETTDDDVIPLVLPFRLHDFGSRGTSSYESAMLGGMGHLVNFLGTDTGPALIGAYQFYGAEIDPEKEAIPDTGIMTAPGYSIPACYDSETEILTNRGFVRFAELSIDDLVGSYSNDASLEFVKPTNIVNQPYNGTMYKFKSSGSIAAVDLLVTPNHRMIRRSRTTGNIEVSTADQFTLSQRNDWVMAGNASGTKTTLSSWDKLKIAFQADGSFVSENRRSDYTGKNSGTIPIRFALKKQRKKDRLEKILTECKIDFTTHETVSGPKSGYTTYWCPIPEDIHMSKNFDWVKFDDVSQSWCFNFIEELQYWDGKLVANTVCYFTTVPENADVVQTISIMAGRRCGLSVSVDKRDNRKDVFNITSVRDKDSRLGKGIMKTNEIYNGTIHCVTVPSGMIVVRRHGTVSISGNSEHSTITSWGKDNEVDAYRNMLRQFGMPNALLAVVSDSYDFFNALEIWGGELKEEVEGMGGTLVVRPDSGDPTIIPVQAVVRLGELFGYTVNSKGYKVLPDCIKVIQGDGIDLDNIRTILENLKDAGWSAENIAFGMGGALLQQPNRDTQKWAMKCSAAMVGDEWRDVFKAPITDPGKESKKGRIGLVIEGGLGSLSYRTKRIEFIKDGQDLIQSVYENGSMLRFQTFDEVRAKSNSWGHEIIETAAKAT